MTIVAICVAVVFGWVILSAVAPSFGIRRGLVGRLERAALSYGLGLGTTAVLMFGLSAVGIELSCVNILAAIGATACVLSVVARRAKRRRLARPSPADRRLPFTLAQKALVAAIVLVILANAVVTLYWPVVSWDALARYDLFARLYHSERTIRLAAIVEPGREDMRKELQYPPLVSLSFAFCYFLGAAQPKGLLLAFYVSFLFLFYLALRKRTPRTGALALTFLVAVTPPLARYASIAYATFPALWYYSLGSLYLIESHEEGAAQAPGVASLLLALATWARPEMFLFVAATIALHAAFGLRAGRVRSWLIPAAVASAVYVPWLLFARYGLGAEPVGISLRRLLDAQWLRTVLTHLRDHLTNVHGLGSAFLLAGASLALDWRNLRAQAFCVALILVNLLVWIVIFQLTGGEPGSQGVGGPDIVGAGERVLLYVVPVAIYAVGRTELARSCLRGRGEHA